MSGKDECKRLGNVYNDEKFTGGNFGGNVWDTHYLAPTLKTGASASQQCICEVKETESHSEWTWTVDGEDYEIKVRKLTPKECWRMMGFSDSDFEKAEKVNSNTQLYKQAGNSIVKQVLMSVFKQMM